MRTAEDFNKFYATPDPWRVTRASFRDRVLCRRLSRIVAGRTVLELGCGEGHLTEAVFGTAKAVTGIDISDLAIGRAKARNLRNAKFDNLDFMQMSFERFDVIAALECVYYLSQAEQDAFFAKVAREHRGKHLIVSGPIIGDGEHRKYFTHAGLSEIFSRLGASVSFHNIIINRRGPVTTLAAAAARLPFCLWILDAVPEPYIFQRCYIIRMM